MFSTRASSKNAKLGYVRKSVFEKNDIFGQNLGQNRGKKSSLKNKLISSTSLRPQNIFLNSKMSQAFTKKKLESRKQPTGYLFFGTNWENSLKKVQKSKNQKSCKPLETNLELLKIRI